MRELSLSTRRHGEFCLDNRFRVHGPIVGWRRHLNLALLQQYGSNAWRIHNYLNEATAKNIEQTLEELKNLTTEVNRDRKNYQVSERPRSTLCAPGLTPMSTDASRNTADLAGNTVDGVDFQYTPDRDGERRARSRDRSSEQARSRACRSCMIPSSSLVLHRPVLLVFFVVGTQSAFQSNRMLWRGFGR